VAAVFAPQLFFSQGRPDSGRPFLSKRFSLLCFTAKIAFINPTIPALVFPAISLLFISHATRFLGMTSVARDILREHPAAAVLGSASG